jgi:hypothetical protein
MDKFWATIAENFIFVVVMLVPISIVAITSYFGHKRTEMIHQERLAAIEKGMMPPGDLKDPGDESHESHDDAAKPAPNFLRCGIFWLCPGLGATAFSLLFLGDVHAGIRLPILGVSIVCAGVGVAYVVIYLLESEKARSGLQ